MASLVASTPHTVSRSWSSAVAEIWRSVGGSLSPSVLQYRSSSDKGLEGRVPPSAEASSAAGPLVDTLLSGKFPPAVAKTRTFGANGSVHDRNVPPPRKWEGFKIGAPIAILKPKLTRTEFSGEGSPVGVCLDHNAYPPRHWERFRVGVRIPMLNPQLSRTALNVGNCVRASRNVAQESCQDSPSQGFVYGKELPIASACGGGNMHMGDAISILKHRQQHGIIMDSYTFVEVLKLCSKQKDLIATRQVHDCIIQSGMDKHPYVATSLLNVYLKCGRLRDARRVFDGLQKTDLTVITWNVVIGAYAKSGFGEEAYRLFLLMKREGFKPNAFTYTSILNASASAGALDWVKAVHSDALKAGLESDLRLGNALVHMYAKSGSIDDARLVFNRMEKRDVFTWTIMIGAYAESGRGLEAYRLLLQMKREGFKPNAITYVSILNASASAGALEWVKEVHAYALKAGLESDLRLGNALVHMYAKSGSIGDARVVFDRMKTRDVITWNKMIGAYAESGRGVEAYRLLLQMKREGFKPDAITYMSILNASASAGALEWVKEVHSDALKVGLESGLRLGNALVHMYAKSGSIDDARLVFNRMEKRDVFTWTAMIGGLAQHGCGHEALELFRQMNVDCVIPDRTTFVAVFSACCHAGLVDDGRRLFLAMTQDYGIEPDVVHYNCMVDLLGRAGHLKEAKLFIDDMPVEPDGVTWKALLGACRTHGNVELGELAAEELLKLEPNDSSGYVLLSNIYAAAGKWEKVRSVRTIMQERGVRKEPGRSWIEVDNKIHEFVVADTSHPEAAEIYTVLKKLTENLKAEGYIPDTKLVLQSIDEEDKELALCSHSEKLAIAYGLMRIPHGKPIRVYKNLRVCSDCHTATKFISKVTGREIIARDANRFHHFKDGVCSCGDYW